MKPPARRKKIKVIEHPEWHTDCIQDIDDLITDLRMAKKNARNTAGFYRVSRNIGDGKKIVISMQFPLSECIRSK